MTDPIAALADLPARGWRYSLFASACDADGSTHVFTLWRAETSGKGQRYPFARSTPALSVEAGLEWLRASEVDRVIDSISAELDRLASSDALADSCVGPVLPQLIALYEGERAATERAMERVALLGGQMRTAEELHATARAVLVALLALLGVGLVVAACVGGAGL